MDMENNKKRFLDKIIKWFVDDTVIYPYRQMWLPTFLQHMTDFPVPLRPLDISRLSLYPLTRLYNHCRDTYGINNDEIDYIWDKYSTIIIDKINNRESINESVDNKKRYLDKVVDFLVDDTELDFKENEIRFPFLYLPIFPSSYHLFLPTSANSLPPFSKYCRDNYGLTDEEIDYVYKEYKHIITDKIKNKH
jgi:hypothetical protein